jgi:hypothetical protein
VRLFTTKGYANRDKDPVPVTSDIILGKVIFHIPAVGWIFSAIKDFLSRYVILIIVILLITLAAFILFFVPSKKKPEAAAPADDRDEALSGYEEPAGRSETRSLFRRPVPPPAERKKYKPVQPILPYIPPAAEPVQPYGSYQFQPADRSAEPIMPPHDPVQDQSVDQIIKNLREMIYKDSKEELETKINEFYEKRHDKIYTDLMSAITKIQQDHDGIINGLDQMMNRP